MRTQTATARAWAPILLGLLAFAACSSGANKPGSPGDMPGSSGAGSSGAGDAGAAVDATTASSSGGGGGSSGGGPTASSGSSGSGDDGSSGGSASSGGASSSGTAPPPVDAGSTPPLLPDAAGVATCAGNPPWTTGGTPAYTLVVDAAQKGPAWSRYYERGVATDHANTILASAYPNGRSIQAALRKGHDEAGFQYARFHGILDSDIGVYTEDASGNPVYTWTKFDQVFDAIQAAGMRPVFEVSFMPPALASGTCMSAANCPLLSHYYGGIPANPTPPKDWTKWQNLMGAIVGHVEGRYTQAEVRNNWYFEVWNEASWMYAGGGYGAPYDNLYKYTVTGLLQGDPMIRVGGPAESGAASQGAIGLLASYAKTNNLRVDFLTYHNYGEPTPGTVASANSAPTSMFPFSRALASTAKGINFTGDVLCDEFGPSYDLNVVRDTEASASFIAKTIHLIGTDPMNPPPAMLAYWTLSDLYEEVNTGTNTAYREGNYGLLLKGDARYPVSYDLAKPAFNAYRLLHAMGDVRLATTGGTTADGVNAAATVSSDGSAVQILVYNHIDGGRGDSTTSSLVTLTVNNLPFGAGPFTVRQYVVDKTHSNSYTAWVGMGKPAQPTQAQWTQLAAAADLCYYETMATPSGNSWTATFPVNVYGVGLIVLSH